MPENGPCFSTGALESLTLILCCDGCSGCNQAAVKCTRPLLTLCPLPEHLSPPCLSRECLHALRGPGKASRSLWTAPPRPPLHLHTLLGHTEQAGVQDLSSGAAAQSVHAPELCPVLRLTFRERRPALRCWCYYPTLEKLPITEASPFPAATGPSIRWQSENFRICKVPAPLVHVSHALSPQCGKRASSCTNHSSAIQSC